MRIIKYGLLAAIGAALTACAPKPKPSGPTPFDRTVKADCYTVDMFTSTAPEPLGSDVPTEWHGFLGSWGGAAWAGQWCHDLHIIAVRSTGEVEMIEAHAPFPERGIEATAFRRIGRIDGDGRLRIRYKDVQVEYWMEKGRLHGLRKDGGGQMRIALTPKPGEA